MIIDCHSHVGLTWPDEFENMTLKDTIKMMDSMGITKACTSTSRYLRHNFILGNKLTHDIVKEYPNRFIGFVLADPLSSYESCNEIEKYYEKGFKGIKLHISHNSIPYDHTLYNDIYMQAEKYSLPILFHAFTEKEVLQCLNVAKKYNKNKYIIGHSGGYEWLKVYNTIAEVKNTYFDLCASVNDRNRVEYFVNAAGSNRVLYGSDFPFLKPSHILSQIEEADLSNEDKEKIRYKNIKELLRI